MVRLHCDRCEREIKDKYYTINIYSHDVNPQYSFATYADTACASNSREDILRTLNTTKMYCKDCKAKIESFIICG
jgi:hypothetical protein